ncbi:MAG: hypothetical protein JOY62_18000 [Acidobacteriaceae bacterium]|nr:hypothetical protein [Acidobacteriaceae bacterium]
MYSRWAAILALFASEALAQTSVNLADQSHNADFANFAFTRTMSVGTSVPSTCSVGQLFFNTSAPAGQNVYGCSQTNTWSALGAMPALGGDLSGTISNASVAKINGTSVPPNSASDQAIVTTSAAAGSWSVLPNCQDSAGQHLNYTTTTHTFSCGSTAGTAYSAPFNSVTNGINTQAAMLIGSGASLGPSGTGVITANSYSGNLAVTNLNGGTNASSTTFWRGDGTWATPPTGGSSSAAGSNNAIQFNNAGVFAGDVTNFAYNPTSHQATVTGGWNGPVIDSGGQVINVMSKGAVCDDSTDDTNAIQLAINTVSPGGGAILFPQARICKITSTLNINNKNIMFLGTSSFQFVTSDIPSSYIDCQVTSMNCINVNQQGFKMRDVSLKMVGFKTAAVPTPAAPALATGSGGSLSNAIYYVQVTCTNSANGGETLVSPEAMLNPGAGGAIIVSPPSCAGSGVTTPGTGYNVYASSASGYEFLQNSSPLSLGSSFTINSIVNVGHRPLVNSTANCAIFDNHAGQYSHVKVFTGSSTGGNPNGFCFQGSSAVVNDGSRASGFYYGLLASLNGVNNLTVQNSFFQGNNYGLVYSAGSNLRLRDNDFEQQQNGDIWILSAAPATADGNYMEVNSNGEYALRVGDNTNMALVNGQYNPAQVTWTDNFMQANGKTGNLVLFDEGVVLDFRNNRISNAGSLTNVIANNYANPTSSITMVGDTTDTTLTSTNWISNTTGLGDYNCGNVANTLITGYHPLEIPLSSSGTISASTSTGALASTTMYTSSGSGKYTFQFYLTQTGAGSGCTTNPVISVNLIYNDGNTGNPITWMISGQSSASATTTSVTLGNSIGAGNQFSSTPLSFYAGPGSIRYQIYESTPAAGCSTLPQLVLYPTLLAN